MDGRGAVRTGSPCRRPHPPPHGTRAGAGTILRDGAPGNGGGARSGRPSS
ncbi:hypothetical protein FM125_01020 [Micrococcus lylae]|uniref:Uncharacterized protein n=1 Tax=Micrococcus lylae TaxID=1273 RepID=A0A1R4I9Z8_9MICC|nr:hypothetical protein FM125_01020 [Micrococcus lylae]